jgi:hypothetical protein
VHPFCNLQSLVGTHAILLICLYELKLQKSSLIQGLQYKMSYHHAVVIKEWMHDVERDLLCRTTLSWLHIVLMRCWKRQNSNDTLVNERQQITWRRAQNVVVLRVFVKKIIRTLLFVLKKNDILGIRSCLVHELIVSQLVVITIRSDTCSHNRFALIQSLVPTHCVCNEYFVIFLEKWKT